MRKLPTTRPARPAVVIRRADSVCRRCDRVIRAAGASLAVMEANDRECVQDRFWMCGGDVRANVPDRFSVDAVSC